MVPSIWTPCVLFFFIFLGGNITQKELHDKLFELRMEEAILKKQNKDTSHIDDQIQKIKKEYGKSKKEELKENGKYKK